MTYERESFGEKSRTGKLGEESVRDEIEEEPTDLDEPEGLYEEDDLEDDDESLELEGEELDDEGEGEEDEDEERASPLAEDAPVKAPRKKKKARGVVAEEREQDEEGFQVVSTLEDEGELEDTPGVRTSGGADVSVMSQSDRRREFPTVMRQERGPGKRRQESARGRRGRKRKATRA